MSGRSASHNGSCDEVWVVYSRNTASSYKPQNALHSARDGCFAVMHWEA